MSKKVEEVTEFSEENSDFFGEQGNEVVENNLDLQLQVINPEAKRRGHPILIRDIRNSNLNDLEKVLVSRFLDLSIIYSGFKDKNGNLLYPEIVKFFEYKAYAIANISLGHKMAGLKRINTQETIQKYEGLPSESKTKGNFLENFKWRGN
jgi:hypothetical protein